MKRDGQILVVEDEPLVGALLASEIERLGFHVLGPAVDSATARALVRGQRPDVALLDFDLGAGESSQSLAEELRELWEVPVVMVSGHVGEPSFEKAVAAFAPSAVLAKPVERGHLGQALSQAMGRLPVPAGDSGEALIAEALITADLTGQVRSLNASAARLLGRPPEHCVGQPLDALIHLHDEDGSRVELMGLTRHLGRELTVNRLRLDRQPSGSVPVTIHLGLLRSQTGGLAGVAVILRAEDEGGRLEGPTLWVARQDHVAAIVLGPDEAVIYANPPAVALLGSGPALAGRGWEEVLAGGRWKLDGSTRSGGDSVVFTLRRPDGGILSAQAVPFDGGHVVLLRDAGEEEEARRRREQAQRLEDLGYLARGYAHELNNRLTAILAGLDRVEDCFAQKRPDWKPALADVRQAATESAGFVRQIQVFSRGGRPVRRPLDPAPWLRALFETLPRRDGVDYRLDIRGAVPMVSVDPSHLEKALENLFANANAAVDVPGGRVTLSACCRLAPSGPILLLSVEDNGCGVAADLLPRLTEPYFTTRARENASGIGLTVCQAIAKAHDGRLEIQSSKGIGSTVTLVLPVFGMPIPVTGLPEAPPPARPMPAPSPGREKLRILVLEDEAMVRRAMVFALRREGWEVVETARGEDTVVAWEEARNSGRPFDLLVSDLTIRGGMGGVETLQRIQTIDPKARALACSGYTDDPVISDPRRFGFLVSLPKPFDPGTLVRAVRQVCAPVKLRSLNFPLAPAPGARIF